MGLWIHFIDLLPDALCLFFIETSLSYLTHLSDERRDAQRSKLNKPSEYIP
jgi:hypothetical protein